MSLFRSFCVKLSLPLVTALAAGTFFASTVVADEVEFRWQPDTNPSAVFLAGDFNNWNPSGTAMTKSGNAWTVKIDLPPGRYQYKFVADGQWHADPNAAGSAPDGFGGQNSVIEVGGSDAAGGLVGGVSSGAVATPAPAAAPAAPAGSAHAPGDVTIAYKAESDHAAVFLAGEFNDWSTTATPMTKADGVWSATLPLAAGRYAYKFVADGSWITDPAATEFIDDGFGGKNSILIVGDAAPAAAPAPTAAPAASAAPAGSAHAPGDVTIAYKAESDHAAMFLAGEFNDWSTTATPMTKADGVWSATLPLAAGRYAYKFVADGSWITDPAAAEFIDDGFGGKNSILIVGDAAPAAAPAPAATPAAPAAPAAPTGPAEDVTFEYQPMISGVSSVHVVGSFNDWNTSATPMQDEDGDGVYTATVSLTPGSHAYKFLVDGQTWLEDPNAEETIDDGFGGQNSVRVVGGQGRTKGDGKPRNVEFSWKPDVVPQEMWLAGTFNEWSVGRTTMTDPDGDGIWTATLLLPEGEYQYKFVIDGNWTTDTKADFFPDDGFGGKNSGFTVDDRFPAIHLALGDGEIFTDGIGHKPTLREINRVSDDSIEFTARSLNDDVERIVLLLDRGKGEEEFLMAPVASDATYQWRRAVVPVAPGTTGRYRFRYEDGDGVLLMTADGFVGPRTSGAPFVFSDETLVQFTTPDWVRDGIFYQIFPERFANGDKSNDPDFAEDYYKGNTTLPAGGTTNGEYYHLVEDWYDTAGLAKSPYRTDGKPDYFSFYGGDIAGVHKNLDYLEDLGVTVLYFNPLFEARSNHKYEAYSYDGIDPHFGTPGEFRAFVDDCHARGIHVVVDWVINHIGNLSPQFLDTVEKGKESEYWDWFEWMRWPLPQVEPEDWTSYYACWWGFHHMPDLNFDLAHPAASEHQVKTIAEATPNQPLIDYVLDSAEWWLKDMDVDGFRLDVANEVPHWMWSLFRERCRSIKEDAYLVGELWGDAGDWIGPTGFDATMNYKYFKDPATTFLGAGRGNAQRFDRQLVAGRLAYPAQATRVLMNLVDSHDTPRCLTAVGDDARRLKLLALFQMTYIGAPHIYYGDEIAMTGAADPDCRRPFRWDWKEDADRVAMHDWYSRLIHLRRENPALITGSFETLLADGGTYAFARTGEKETFVVVLNAADRDAAVRVPVAGVGERFEDVVGKRGKLEAADGELSIALPAVSGTILRVR